MTYISRGIGFIPATAKSLYSNFGAISHQRAPTDAISYPKISFTGVADNTEVRVFRTSDNEELAGVENYSQGTELTVPHYGSGLSEVRIVLHSLAHEYLSFNFDVPRTDVLIPIVQRPDRNYYNP